MSGSILVVHSSPAIETSSTRKIARALVGRLVAAMPEAAVLERDLVREPIPHFVPGPDAEARADRLCREFLAADVVVVGAPMWNFSIPSVLKAWIDHIVRAGATFRYTAHGPEGIVPAGKKVYLIEATGGDYDAPGAARLNHVGPYLVQVFGFLGVRDIELIAVPGTATQKSGSEENALKIIHRIELSNRMGRGEITI